MKYILLVCVIGGLVGCNNPEATQSTSNKDYEVSKLFTYGVCEIFRFSDNGMYQYYTVCGNPPVAGQIITNPNN